MKVASIHLAVIAVYLSAAPSARAQDACQPPTEMRSCSAMSEALTKIYHASTNRIRGGGVMVPADVVQGYRVLQSRQIPLLETITQLASAANLNEMRERIIQEFVRGAPKNGMPWLPASWSSEHRDVELSSGFTATTLERSLVGIPRPWTPDQWVTVIAFTGVIPHTGNLTLIDELRRVAAELAMNIPEFWDIRVEIHQEPSLRTLQNVTAFARSHALDPDNAARLTNITQMLQGLFGGGETEKYLNRVQLSPDERSRLTAAVDLLKLLPKSTTSETFATLIPKIVQSLDALAVQTELARTRIEKYSAATATCDVAGPGMDCLFEHIDLIRQVQGLSFALGNAAVERSILVGYAWSLNEIRSLSEALLKISVTLGLIIPEAAGSLAELSKNGTNSGDPTLASITGSTLHAVFEQVEQSLTGAAQNVRGPMLSLFAKYRPFAPIVDRWVDDTLRNSPVLVLSNFIAAFRQSLKQAAGGLRLWIDENPTSIKFRVLNPGIARGKLYIPKAQDLLDERFVWDPRGIYLLEKTPAELNKVAGILTIDSGSMISHVQLLASNHGIPNVFVSKLLIDALRTLEGQDILLTAVPEGEVQVHLWKKSPRDHLRVFEEYNNARQRSRVELKFPAGALTHQKPLALGELRMRDSGIIAGGKACGQGELSRVFDQTVPAGIVLPFGVYYEHVKRTGIYDAIRDAFSSPVTLASKDALRAALVQIRQRILTTELSAELKQSIRQSLSQPPFITRRGAPRGVFVRSDTNAEDLPEFVGAGLNLTVPNVVGTEAVFEAIKAVWASPFTEKSFTWREDLIKNPWNIFPSVIIQIGINSERAGVMVVGDTRSNDADDLVTLAANEGLGITVVNGEYSPEEILYSRKTKTVRRLRRAFAPNKKQMVETGGFVDLPASGDEEVLSDVDVLMLATAGDTIQKHLLTEARSPGTTNISSDGLQKWDLEWGFVGQKLILFQIRPFIGNKIAKNVGSLSTLRKETPRADFLVSPTESRFILTREQD